MGFSRQEHWSGFPFLSPGDLPNLGIKPGSQALQADSLLSELPGIPKYTSENKNKNQLLLKAGGGEERKQRQRRVELAQESDVLGVAGTELPGQGGPRLRHTHL